MTSHGTSPISRAVAVLVTAWLITAGTLVYVLLEARSGATTPSPYVLSSRINVTAGVNPPGVYNTSFLSPSTGARTLDAVNIWFSTNVTGRCGVREWDSLPCGITIYVSNWSLGFRSVIFTGGFPWDNPTNLLIPGGNYTYSFYIGNLTSPYREYFLVSIVITMMGQVIEPALPVL